MLVTQLFSGLLAAVMVALGAGQIGNSSTQVGEEPVVEESKVQMASFALVDDTDRLEPENYEHAPGNTPCSSGKLEICYIIAEVANPNDDEEDWLPVISEELEDEIAQIFEEDPDFRDDTDNVKLRGL